MVNDEYRTERKKTRLAPSEKERLLRLADAAGMSVAAVVRVLGITIGSFHDMNSWSHARDFAQHLSGVRMLSAEAAKTHTELRCIGDNANREPK